jgi:hemerythrin-like domain-containing protein
MAREALRRTLRYFGTGVPRHAADEEESLFPRLRAAAEQGELPRGISVGALARALETLAMLEREHAAAEAAHQELDTLGEMLLEKGQFESSEDRARFQELIRTLRALYRDHIRIEDEELFPLAAQTVDAVERDAIGTEMAGRRGINRQKHRELVSILESRPWSRRPARDEEALL